VWVKDTHLVIEKNKIIKDVTKIIWKKICQ
jgi:hypothetical protein